MNSIIANKFLNKDAIYLIFPRKANIQSVQILSWSDVSRIIYFYQEMPVCASCRKTNIDLPRVTKCGHIFCLLCFIDFLLSRKEEQAPCPVCRAPGITVKELKVVSFVRRQVPVIGQTVSFRLMVEVQGNASPVLVKGLVPVNDGALQNKTIWNTKLFAVLKDSCNLVGYLTNELSNLKRRFPNKPEKYTPAQVTLDELKSRVGSSTTRCCPVLEFLNLTKPHLPPHRYRLFYQSTDFRLTYLTQTYADGIVNQFTGMGMMPPKEIQGLVSSVAPQTVAACQVLNSHQLPGAKVYIVELQTETYIHFTPMELQQFSSGPS